MNTVLSAPVDRQHQHPPQSPEHDTATRRVGLADRVALHVGLALITWSRRPGTHAHQLSRNNLRVQRNWSADRARREWKAERQLRLTLPPR